MTTTTTKGVCGTCDGSGTRPAFKHYANGVCFHCSGTGTVRVSRGTAGRPDTMTTVQKVRSWYRQARTGAVVQDDFSYGSELETIRSVPGAAEAFRALGWEL